MSRGGNKDFTGGGWGDGGGRGRGRDKGGEEEEDEKKEEEEQQKENSVVVIPDVCGHFQQWTYNEEDKDNAAMMSLKTNGNGDYDDDGDDRR